MLYCIIEKHHCSVLEDLLQAVVSGYYCVLYITLITLITYYTYYTYYKLWSVNSLSDLRLI